MFTSEEKQTLFELICNEQISMIGKSEQKTDRYNLLEELKVKIRTDAVKGE